MGKKLSESGTQICVVVDIDSMIMISGDKKSQKTKMEKDKKKTKETEETKGQKD